MQLNMKRTKFLAIGARQELPLFFGGEKVDMVTPYKYLGVEVSQSMSWATCVKHRVAYGYKAFYTMIKSAKQQTLLHGH